MFKQLPRQTFRDVQEVLFPAYFQLNTLCISLLAVLAPLAAAVTTQQWQLLGVSMAATLANLLYFEPRTSAVMQKRAAMERMSSSEVLAVDAAGKEAAMKALGSSFGALHGASSAFNLAAFVSCIVYGWSRML